MRRLGYCSRSPDSRERIPIQEPDTFDAHRRRPVQHSDAARRDRTPRCGAEPVRSCTYLKRRYLQLGAPPHTPIGRRRRACERHSQFQSTRSMVPRAPPRQRGCEQSCREILRLVTKAIPQRTQREHARCRRYVLVMHSRGEERARQSLCFGAIGRVQAPTIFAELREPHVPVKRFILSHLKEPDTEPVFTERPRLSSLYLMPATSWCHCRLHERDRALGVARRDS